MDPNMTVAQAVQHVWETTTLGDVQRVFSFVAVAVGFWVAVFVAAAAAVAAVAAFPYLRYRYWRWQAKRKRGRARDRRFDTVCRALLFGDEDAKAAILGRGDDGKVSFSLDPEDIGDTGEVFVPKGEGPNGPVLERRSPPTLAELFCYKCGMSIPPGEPKEPLADGRWRHAPECPMPDESKAGDWRTLRPIRCYICGQRIDLLTAERAHRNDYGQIDGLAHETCVEKVREDKRRLGVS